MTTTLLFAFLGIFTWAAPVGDDAALQAARDYFATLRAGDYARCVEVADEKMRAAMPPDKAAAVWAQVTGAFGEYVSELATAVTPSGDYQIVDLTSKFARGTLRVRISVNADGKISGLFFTPVAEPAAYVPPAYVDTQGFREEAVTVDAGGWPLPGTLSLPAGDGPHPAVVLVHGSGPHDQDESINQTKPFRDLAWGLASRGVAVLRYEKRTHKYGDRMQSADVTVRAEVTDDALAAARLLRQRPDIASNGVYVLGHSLGATAAPFIGRQDPQLAGVILVAPAARPIPELVLDQVTYIANVDGEITAEERQQIDAVAAAIEKFKSGEAGPQEPLLGAPVSYWRTLDELAPLESGRAYERPMLLIFGGRDYQVTARESELWQQALAGRPNVTIEIFPKLDHLMHTGDAPSKPADYDVPGYVDEAVVKRIAEWVKASRG